MPVQALAFHKAGLKIHIDQLVIHSSYPLKLKVAPCCNTMQSQLIFLKDMQCRQHCHTVLEWIIVAQSKGLFLSIQFQIYRMMCTQNLSGLLLVDPTLSLLRKQIPHP